MKVQLDGRLDPIHLHLVSETGDYLSGTKVFVFDDWPPYIDPSDYVEPPLPDPPLEEPEGPIKFRVYSLPHPKQYVRVTSGPNHYGCSIMEMVGGRVTLRPRFAGNIKALMQLQLRTW